MSRTAFLRCHVHNFQTTLSISLDASIFSFFLRYFSFSCPLFSYVIPEASPLRWDDKHVLPGSVRPLAKVIYSTATLLRAFRRMRRFHTPCSFIRQKDQGMFLAPIPSKVTFFCSQRVYSTLYLHMLFPSEIPFLLHISASYLFAEALPPPNLLKTEKMAHVA